MAAHKHIHGRQLGAFGSLTYRSHAPCPPACMQLRMLRPRRGDQHPIPARRPASTSGAASAALPAMQHGRAQTRHPHTRAAGGATSSRVRQRTGQRPGADLQGPDPRGARRGSADRAHGSSAAGPEAHDHVSQHSSRQSVDSPRTSPLAACATCESSKSRPSNRTVARERQLQSPTRKRA